MVGGVLTTDILLLPKLDCMIPYLATWILCYLRLARINRAIVTFGARLSTRVLKEPRLIF